MSFINNQSIRRAAIIGMIGWTLLISLSFSWNFYNNMNKTSELAILEARALFNKDKAFRFWAASHGGVYVPPSEKTPPNPFLAHIPDRDIETTSGKKLTLMNPAYMVRQMMETYEKVYGVKGHITSTIHFRPETAPDDWEKKTLGRFENGEKEVVEFSEIDGQPFLRLMQPLYAQKSCLKCHGHQGYKEGDLRGGVSLSLPIHQHITAQKTSILILLATHLIFWILGIISIVIYGKRLGEKTDALYAHSEHLEEMVAKRTSELETSKKELEKTNKSLESLNEALSQREGRIVEVKQEVNDLCRELGRDILYKEIDHA